MLNAFFCVSFYTSSRDRENPFSPDIRKEKNKMNQIQEQDRGSGKRRVLFDVVIGGIVLLVLLEVIAQLLPPHYNPLSQSESDLAVGPYGFVMASGFAVGGLLLLLFIAGFTRVIPKEAQSRAGLVLLTIAAIGKLIITFAATDLTARPHTIHGTIHALAAAVSFFCGALGLLLLTHAMRRDTRLHLASGALMGLASVTLIWTMIVLATLVVSSRIGVWGLFERLATGLYLLWVLLVSLRLRHLPSREEATMQKTYLSPEEMIRQ
jgi:Protein of unknown function (DUF998)